jgi:polysaccharide deacetylase family protein (PEP-CTERM system associated)
MTAGPLNAFTVDVEDYFQVSAFERAIPRAEWERFEGRVVANTRRMLELLARHHVRGTFFVLGWIAERHGQLVREIHQAGHEIGSHGHWHRLIYESSPEEFRDDLRRSRQAIQRAVESPVVLHRAASFSITRRSLWALQILAEEGFQIDSSVFPIYHDRYGIPDAEPAIHQIATPAGSVWEFPPSVAELGLIRVPVSGGGYFRLYPYWLTRALLSRVNRRQNRPFVFYVHPWEIDPGQPRLAAGSRLCRMRHYANLATTERKLEKLLRRFRFGTVSEVVAAAGKCQVSSPMPQLPNKLQIPDLKSPSAQLTATRVLSL